MTDPEKLAALAVTLSERDIENLADAAKIIGISRGFGHGPGAHCQKGERIAGFYYRNDDAAGGDVLPAHCIGSIRELVLDLSEQVSRALAKE